ncbi:MAG: GerAB/ArcD/ProY family transporter, partial [Clostridiaceae bacterium]|nr:GerAB/ArcD/ProY family transporter [Clostridiaceae bacterium]
MIKEGNLGPQEAICLITITIVTRVFFTSPSVITRFVGSAGWLMTLISATTAMIIFYLVLLLLRKWPGKNIIEIYELSTGRYIGFIFSFALFAGFLIDSAALLREFTEVMKVYVLPISPPSYIMGIFFAGVFVVCIFGLEAQARLARVVAPVLLVSLIVVLLLAAKNYSLHRLNPIFGYGLDRVLLRGIRRNSVYGYAIITAVIAGSLQGIEHIKKIGYTSIIISGIIISVCVLCFSLTFPYYVAQEITSPLYEMVSLVDHGRFFQRLDPLFLFTWIIATLIAVTAEVYMAASIYCRMFRIQDIKPIIAPICV